MKRILLLSAIALVLASVGDLRADSKSSDPKSSDKLVRSLVRQTPRLRSEMLRLALDATERATKRGLVKRNHLLTVIDYSLPSTQPRL